MTLRDDGRRILHVDMDAFYASVEQRDDPALRGKPIAVGGDRRGVVAAASYEARAFGVRSAMPMSIAQRRCPGLIVVAPRFEAYRAASREIRAIFERHGDAVEPLSLDEAYIDVTGAAPRSGGAKAIALAIKGEILARTELTASAGVSFNKFLAKLASDENKPDGLTVVRHRDALAYLRATPIERFFGVGPVTAGKLRALGYADGGALQDASEVELARALGGFGLRLARLALGVDHRPVRAERIRKSVGCERTYAEDRIGLAQMDEALRALACELWARLERAEFDGRTFVLKYRLPDFTSRTRSRTEARPIRALAREGGGAEPLASLGSTLLRLADPPARVRLLGLTVAGGEIEADRRQLSLSL